MRHLFESLGYQSGFFLSQLFSSTRTCTNPFPLPPPLKQTQASRLPQQIFNWTHPPFHTAPPPPHGFHHPSTTPLPHSDEDMIVDHDPDLKWPDGLSFFNALTGRVDDAKLLFSSDGLGSKPPVHHQQQQLMMSGKKVRSGKTRQR
ncbi:hypothetical protein KSP40_PGU020461 [Platanthera guangdongensis]|uniref:Uncharacterized protein n=1 Tax=Platanthera guangdongensis TaxID=2320717 RepID=A0ABR2M1T3_9ASPA